MTEHASEYRSGGADPLERLAERLEKDPQFMAFLLKRYCGVEGWTVDRMIDFLKTDKSTYTRLALCKRPEADASNFAEQVRQIAEYTQILAGLIAGIVRQMDALDGLQARTVDGRTGQTNPEWQATPGLAAARDRLAQSNTLRESRADEDATYLVQPAAPASAARPTARPDAGTSPSEPPPADQEESPDDSDEDDSDEPPARPDDPVAG